MEHKAKTIGSTEAVRLIVRHERALRSYLGLLLVADHDVDDMIQEVSLIAWEKLGEFQYSRKTPDEEFRAWLGQIAKFKVMNMRRKFARRRQVALSDQLVEELSTLVHSQANRLDQRHEALNCCIDKLRPDQRELLILRYGAEQTVEELASRSNRTTEGVYKFLQRIRRQLLDCIDRSLVSVQTTQELKQ